MQASGQGPRSVSNSTRQHSPVQTPQQIRPSNQRSQHTIPPRLSQSVSDTQVSHESIEILLTAASDEAEEDETVIPDTPPSLQDSCPDQDMARLARVLGGVELNGNPDLQHHLAQVLRLMRASQ